MINGKYPFEYSKKFTGVSHKPYVDTVDTYETKLLFLTTIVNFEVYESKKFGNLTEKLS